MNLTDFKIKSLKPKDKLYRIFDGQGYGLYLEVLPTGSKKWRLKYLSEGRYRCITLGTFPSTNLREARDKAIEQKRLLESGKDPLTERSQKRQNESNALTSTLIAAVERFIDRPEAMRKDIDAATVKIHEDFTAYLNELWQGNEGGFIFSDAMINFCLQRLANLSVVVTYQQETINCLLERIKDESAHS